MLSPSRRRIGRIVIVFIRFIIVSTLPTVIIIDPDLHTPRNPET